MRSTLRASAAIGRRLPAALIACAVCLVAAPAASAGVWLPPQDLSAPGRDATNPAVAMADSGATTAIWEKDNTKDAGFHGEAATREPSQGFSAPAELVGGVTDPQLEMTGGGAGGRGLEAARQSARRLHDPGRRPGRPAAPSERRSTPPKCRPTVIPNGLQMALNDAGDVAIAWTRDDPGSIVDKNATFVEATVGHAGGGFSEPEHVSLPIEPPIEEEEEGKKTILHLNAVEPSVAIDPAGDVVVVWRYFDGTDEVIEAAERPAGGTFSKPRSDLQQRRRLRRTGGRDGRVRQRDRGLGGVRRDGFGGQSRAASPGGEFEPADDLSESGESSFGPEIAMTPAGLATVVWTRAEDRRTVDRDLEPPARRRFLGGGERDPRRRTLGRAGRHRPEDERRRGRGRRLARPGDGWAARSSRRRSAPAPAPSRLRPKSRRRAPTSSTPTSRSTPAATRP